MANIFLNPLMDSSHLGNCHGYPHNFSSKQTNKKATKQKNHGPKTRPSTVKYTIWISKMRTGDHVTVLMGISY